MINQQDSILTTSDSWAIDRTAISPYKSYCDGYIAPGSEGLGYVSVLKVETGTTTRTQDPLLDDIVAYDTAESKGTYIGQINMITASSFSGVAGQIWGYDLAQHDDISSGKSKVEFTTGNYDGTVMNCYDAYPLLEAGKELFGTQDARRYPLVPGAHTICANKNVSAYRPISGEPVNEGEATGVWSVIAIAIARDRTQGANLFIEDAGLWYRDDEAEFKSYMESLKIQVANCASFCGKNARVSFERCYIGYSYTLMKPGEVGMAITVGPYVSLAQKAIPGGGFDQLNNMTLSEWINQQG